MFGSHSLNGFEIVYLFPEWGSKHPLTPPPSPSPSRSDSEDDILMGTGALRRACLQAQG